MLSVQSYAERAFDEWHVKLLQDVVAHVSLALANADHFAQAQTERARLEALHLFEMGVAGASYFFERWGRHTKYWRDWSSDVCSSDLVVRARRARTTARRGTARAR